MQLVVPGCGVPRCQPWYAYHKSLTLVTTPNLTCAAAHIHSQEHAEGAKRWMKNVPFAYETPEGPRMNNKFVPYFLHSFPNKMSRVLIVSAS
jgi:hypothetical protein